MERILSDVRFVLRTCRKSPLFVTVALLSLALGIGANSAIFSLLDQVLLRSLPVKDPQQLVVLDWDGTISGFMWNMHTFSHPEYVEFQEHSKELLAGLAARFTTPVDVGWNGSAERRNAELVSGNYFDVLGVQAAVGHTLTPDEDQVKNAEPYCVLSYGYWQKRFGGSPAVVGQTVDVNHRPMTVVGVAQKGFRGTDPATPADIFVPMAMKTVATPTWDRMDDRRAYWLNIIGRLRPDVPREKALAGMRVLYRRAQMEDIKANPHATPRFRRRYLSNKFTFESPGLLSSIREEAATPLLLLMAMVGTLLLIACGNVANLLVARAATRQNEIAIRLSLGATKLAIVRLVLIESFLLSFAGGALGLLVAAWSGSALLRVLPFETFSQAISTSLDVRVVVFTAVISVLTAVIFGLTPALQIAKPNVTATLKNESRSVAGGGHIAMRKGMVAAQISLSLLLLVGAGLFARSLYNIMAANAGMQTENILEFSIDPSLAGYSNQRVRLLQSQLEHDLSGLPGVLATSGAEVPVLADNDTMRTTQAEGFIPKEGDDANPYVNAVLPNFFAALNIPFIAGRDFSERDIFNAPKVAIVNESFVNFYFHGRNPLGRHIGFGPPGSKLDMEIAGVVKDAKSKDLKSQPGKEVYVPALQDENPGALTYYLRTGGDANEMARLARRAVRQRDSSLPIFDMKTIATQIRETHYVDRLITLLSVAFGLLATLLAAVGLYGVMAFTVARRTRELGIRMALGAQRGEVLRLVMKEVLLVAGIGIGVALPLALGLGRLIQGQLFGLTAADPGVLAGAALVLTLVAMAAGLVPALRATRIDPVNALRWE